MAIDDAKTPKPFEELVGEEHRLLSTSDREEAIAAVADAIWPISVEFRKSQGAFQFDIGGRRAAGLDVTVLSQASDGGYVSRLEPVEGAYILETALSGNSTVRTAGRAFAVGEGTAVLVSPGEPVTWIDSGAPYVGVSISIPSKIVETTLSALTGADPVGRLTFDPRIDFTTRRGRELQRMLEGLIDAASASGSMLDHPVAAAQFQDLLVSCLLTGFENSASAGLQATAPDSGHSAVERARSFIDAHSAEAITSDRLAKVSAASVRSLQRSFRDATGLTPMQYLKLVRLERVRTRLLKDGPTAQISSIAMSEGFGHLGHFSADYKRAYGESPSQTARLSAQG